MKYVSMASAMLVSVLLAACGGGGSTMSPSGVVPPAVTSPQAPAAPGMPAAPAPPGAPASPSSVLQTAVLNGSPTFITSAQLPVYTFGGDTVPNQSACTGTCLTIWPAVAPPPGPLPAPWSSFTRSDNGQMQLAYNGQPLYTFISDTPLHATGEGVQNFHQAHPLASASPAPTMPPAAPATPAPPPPGPIY